MTKFSTAHFLADVVDRICIDKAKSLERLARIRWVLLTVEPSGTSTSLQMRNMFQKFGNDAKLNLHARYWRVFIYLENTCYIQEFYLLKTRKLLTVIC